MSEIGSVKREIRIAGFDDAPFTFGGKKTRLIGTIFRGGSWLDGVVTGEIEIDGHDSTEKITELINGSPHRQQLRVVMLDGVTFGGFNIADIEKIHEDTGLPVISVVRDMPAFDSIRLALQKFEDADTRWELIRKAGDVKPMEVVNPKTGKVKKMWFQNKGISPESAREVIRISSTRSFMPEPLRVAHLIGQGLGVEYGK